MNNAAPDRKSNIVGGADRFSVGACLRLGALQRLCKILCAATISVLTLAACNEDQQNPDGSLSSVNGGRSLSVIGSIRPRASQETLEKIHQEDAERIKQQQEALAAQAQQQQQQNAAADPANRDLPAVDQSPISGIANVFGWGQNNNNQPTSQPATSGSPNTMTQGGVPSPPPTATYGGGYQGGGLSGMIPPPPAVSLSTQAAPMYPAPPPAMPYPQYYDPYGGGYPQYQQPAATPAHPAGSMFSNGNSGAAASASTDEPKKQKNIVLITPTGMEARSPYKQRDDLKVLIKGAFASAREPELRDAKVAAVLARADVGLPADATKGNISLTQRQIDTLFKLPPIDKRVLPSVKKVETDVAQSYYRYLYAFNKFALTQQQVAARKQEMEVADSNSEKQRAAADLSAAQQDADGSKEDLRAAQLDLAATAGAQAARSVITRVSGVAPSLESLAVAEQEAAPEQQGGILGSVTNAFGALNFWGKKKEGEPQGEQVASTPVEQPKPAKDKGKDKKKGKGEAAPAPAKIAAAPAESSPAAVERPAAGSSSGISFELKNVQTTPRKSVLRVAVRNNSGDSFNLDPDVVSVLEGDKKLPEAAVRAEFDSTLVGPNQEVSGTVTIFGRPWNDKLSVSLSEGGRSIQLHR